MTIDIAGLPPEGIVFETSPLAELCLTLHALSEPGHHPGREGWAQATAAALRPDLADRLQEADFLWRNTFSDLFMPFAGVRGGDGRAGATLAEELDMLDELDDEQFVVTALEFTCLSSYDRGGPSPLSDAETRARVLELALARGPGQAEFAGRLLRDPCSVRAWVRRLFEDCDEAFFADIWRRIEPALAADARHKAELLRHKGLDAALAAVSPALALEEDGARIRVDKLAEGHATAFAPDVAPGLTFVPSHFGWPHLMVLHRPRWRPVVHYPIGSPELPAATSVELLKLRLEALAHPVRMQLCRSTARAPHTTGELAGVLGLTAPEVSRHLAVLRRAGLITAQRRGRYVHYQLDVRAVARLSGEFLEGILR
ncbi:DUF5937 family protein [Streptomyces sp. UNOC14_S4]|uniref:DUF5937 family protein n=1 Tax=Streptomyces sp. UNOC14_S4 TaxID=2872340 RepID=UPI001E41B174|nr:DUF5937 family protein [Streptomyces sp. UNOC14_S4]MCC3768562.1 metalloregulator ArsR/SmtB family transcription factor [Streptomyces sp. UNOC14_S4]